MVEPGVTRKALNEHLRDQGLFFPIDPGADASLGGMAATRCSGTNAVRYGTMKDNVLALKVVMAERRADDHGAPRQEIVGRLRSHAADGRLGRHARRHHRADAQAVRHSGSDRRRRLSVPVGRGRLQRDHPHHPVRHSGRAHRTARRAADQGGQCLFQARRCRKCRCCSSNSTARDAGVAEQSERFGEIVADLGGGPFDWATKPEDRTRLWQARHDGYWAARHLRPGAAAFATDVCVPISRLAECVTATPARHRRAQAGRADRRPCRRRQFPSDAAGRHGRRRRGQPRRGS